MGKYDKEVKNVYLNYKPITITSYNEFLKYNEIAFSQLLTVIKEYRSRFIPKSKVIQYLDEIMNTSNYKKVIDDIRNNIIEETISEETILVELHESANIILGMITFTSEKGTQEILDNIYSLYLKKNDSYGDAWHGRGSYGIYTELERKVFRFKNVILNNAVIKDNETIEDTLRDTINYITFFIVCLKCVDPYI
ncbi:MAG: hypothetical protein HDR04_19520 [Lachnospiraceae bacterium]|nr:hypothetical protein [Lachnospiraceae bacterium]